MFANNQFYDKSLMPESDGDEMLCHFKIRRVEPGHVFAKVNRFQNALISMLLLMCLIF